MIKDFKLLPVTAKSYPFQTAVHKCNFAARGYIEDEYLMSGTANVYTEDEHHTPTAIFENAPYATRVLVRRPAEAAAFSGNVVVEILNASAMMDIDRMWVNSWQYFMRNGDIYVGISSKGHVVGALKKFDAVRYADVCWDNPMPEREAPEGARGGPFGHLAEFESGLFWDMFVDLAKLLRGDSQMNPIAGYGNRSVTATGWSQSGSYITRMVKSFPGNFDGYLAAGCGAGLAPINAYEPPAEPFFSRGVPKGGVMGAPEPYININTESENRPSNWLGDFDQPDFKFRTYQIPGSSHDSHYSLIEYYEGQLAKDVTKIYGFELGYEGVDGEPMDFPFEPIFNAAFRNLYVWVREGVPAPHAPPIETEVVAKEFADPFGAQLRNRTDALGNAKGGIRSPALDYPTGVYTSFSKKADGSIIPMFGKVQPFSAEKLKSLYGDIANYERLVTKGTDEMIASGFLLAEDKERYIKLIVDKAKSRGL